MPIARSAPAAMSERATQSAAPKVTRSTAQVELARAMRGRDKRKGTDSQLAEQARNRDHDSSDPRGQTKKTAEDRLEASAHRASIRPPT